MKKIIAAFLSVMLLILPVAAATVPAQSPEATHKSNLYGAAVSPNAKENSNAAEKTPSPKGTNQPAVTEAPKAKTKSNIETNLMKMIGKSEADKTTPSPKGTDKLSATEAPKEESKSTLQTGLLKMIGKSNEAEMTPSPKGLGKPTVTASPKAKAEKNMPAAKASPKENEKANPLGVPETKAASAVLMERETGTVLYEKNAHEKLEPASVTKVMTMLLITEAIEDGRLSRQDMVTVSGYAASMGGSQVFLEEGEQMSVNDLLKAVAVASGNDAAVALAEAIAGSEEAFVARMNERAKELGMNDTTFKNCTGLPAEGHITSAYDIAIMSRELLKCPFIREFTTIWMDSLRNGSFGLSNTNKLVRFYKGATGLKTGSTDSALFCLSATAERNGMELIATVMKAPTSNDRFETAKSLLNYGFANYQIVDVYPERALPPIDVELGEKNAVQPVLAKSSRILVEKTAAKSLTQKTTVCEKVEAPVEKGQKLGEMVVSVDGKVRETIPVVASEAVPRLTIGGLFKRMTEILFMKEK